MSDLFFVSPIFGFAFSGVQTCRKRLIEILWEDLHACGRFRLQLFTLRGSGLKVEYAPGKQAPASYYLTARQSADTISLLSCHDKAPPLLSCDGSSSSRAKRNAAASGGAY